MNQEESRKQSKPAESSFSLYNCISLKLKPHESDRTAAALLFIFSRANSRELRKYTHSQKKAPSLMSVYRFLVRAIPRGRLLRVPSCLSSKFAKSNGQKHRRLSPCVLLFAADQEVHGGSDHDKMHRPRRRFERKSFSHLLREMLRERSLCFADACCAWHSIGARRGSCEWKSAALYLRKSDKSCCESARWHYLFFVLCEVIVSCSALSALVDGAQCFYCTGDKHCGKWKRVVKCCKRAATPSMKCSDGINSWPWWDYVFLYEANC